MKIAYIGIDLFLPAPQILTAAGAEIAEIFTCETDNVCEFNRGIIEFAEKNEIPYTLRRITKSDIERLKNAGAEAAVCAGYYYKIPADTGFPIVNIHPSLLPEGRGSWPMPHDILSGAKESGVTVHKIAEGFDTGDILMQRRFRISEEENLDTFMKKVREMLPDMLTELMKNFSYLYANAAGQGEGTYISAQTERDWTITYEMTVETADKILRAFYGYECIYRGKGKVVKIRRGRARRGVRHTAELPLSDGYVEASELW